jgi:hypothetical protein
MQRHLTLLPALLIAAVALSSAAACDMVRGHNLASDGEHNTADLGMAPYASFGNSASSPGGANASKASSESVPRGPGASNYNGPNMPTG